MNELDKIDARIDKRITCIIEDYKALKSEISRRSDLQRFALLAYGGVIVFSLKINDNASFSDFQIILIWVTSSVAYLFYLSEDSFIQRLNQIAIFNSWLISHLLNQDHEEQSSNVPLANNGFGDYINEINNIKKNKTEEIIHLKYIIFPSESAVIGRIIKTNKVAEIFSFSFLLSYLIFLPFIITSNHFNDSWHIFSSLNTSLFCLIINVCFSLYLLIVIFSKSSKFS